MLPFFFRQYDSIVDQYFVYDNGSTDRSLVLLEEHPKVSVRHFDAAHDSFVEEERRLSDLIWKESRGVADWVIVLDIDEHIHHPALRAYLQRCSDHGITAIRGLGYEMVADHFPDADSRLTESVPIGSRSAGHDKLCIFNPAAVQESNFAPGRHLAAPTGHVRWPNYPEVLLLHYKQLGVEYIIRRSAELRRGLRERDIEQQWGIQYLWTEAEIAERWSRLRSIALPVPGLGVLSDVAPEFYDEEHVVQESGLLDEDWYLSTYPDVQAAGANALSHYCIDGWKEDRRPNFYFHTNWYREQDPSVAGKAQNPLLHYIVSGESEGAQPSPFFDTRWYRERYELTSGESPLAHYLANRSSGRFSPSPDFDMEAYVEEFPSRIMGFEDPFEEFCWKESRPRISSPTTHLPTFGEVVSTLGFDPLSLQGSAKVDAAVLVGTLRLFLNSIPMDEDWYCANYPDIADAIDSGAITSAREHFVESGFFEGRRPVPDNALDP